MRGAVLHAPGDVRLDTRDDPRIEHPTDAIIRLAATWCAARTCGPTAASKTVDGPAPMGHEYAGIVEEAGTAVTTLKPGQFVVGSFFASDNTCEICQAGYQSRCVHAEMMGAIGTQAEYARIPLADGTLAAPPAMPDEKFVPSLLAASDVLGTGWFDAVAADVAPGKTVAVAGDGAVGLLGVLAACELGAERIIAFSRHQSRQKLARELGAIDIVTERGEDGAARVKDLTGGLGAHCVIEAVGTQESMTQAIRSTARADTSASHTTSPCPATSCSSPRSTSTADPPRSGASCPTLSTASSPEPSTPAPSSTSHSRSIRSPKATKPWTNMRHQNPAAALNGAAEPVVVARQQQHRLTGRHSGQRGRYRGEPNSSRSPSRAADGGTSADRRPAGASGTLPGRPEPPDLCAARIPAPRWITSANSAIRSLALAGNGHVLL
jgi:threonine dehydrogenase-like Zn-dependent dehydrogenase